MALRTVKIIADAGNKNLPTVNINDSVVGIAGEIEQCLQASGTVDKEIPTYQGVTGTSGPKNIIIDGFTGPA